MGKLETIVEALDDDGASVECDGRVWTVRTEPDEWTNIMDGDAGDWYGELSWDGPRNAYGWHTRPDGMDGRARKIMHDRDAAIWWEPPADVTDADMLRTMARQLRDILEYGYNVVVVETDDGRFAALGGVEPFADGPYLAGIVGELVDEIAHEIHDDEVKRVREIAAAAMFAVVGP